MTDWLIPCQPSVCQSVSSEQNYVMGHKSILFGSVPFQDNSFLSYTYCVQGTPTTTGALRTEYSSSSYVKDLWFHLSIHGGRHSRPTITTLPQSVWMFSAVTKKKSGREEGRYVHFATNCFIGYMLLFYGYVYNGYGEYLEGTGIQYECYRKECRRRFCVKRCRGDALCMCGNAALLLMVVGEGQIIIKTLLGMDLYRVHRASSVHMVRVFSTPNWLDDGCDSWLGDICCHLVVGEGERGSVIWYSQVVQAGGNVRGLWAEPL